MAVSPPVAPTLSHPTWDSPPLWIQTTSAGPGIHGRPRTPPAPITCRHISPARGPLYPPVPRRTPSCLAAQNRAKRGREQSHLPGPHETGYLPGARKSTTLFTLGTRLTHPRDQTIPRLRRFTAAGTFRSDFLDRGMWISSCSSPRRRSTPSAGGWGGETEAYSRWAGQFQQYFRCRHPLNPR